MWTGIVWQLDRLTAVHDFFLGGGMTTSAALQIELDVRRSQHCTHSAGPCKN